jgi:hypothetical protein
MAIEFTDVADLVIASQPAREKDHLTDLSTEWTELVGLRHLVENHRTTIAGSKFEFQALTGFCDTAEHVGLYHVDTPTVEDHLTTGEIPWKATRASMSFDLMEEALNSTEEERILNHVKVKRLQRDISLTVKAEKFIFGKPATSADVTTPYGLDMWITFPAAYAADGFVGVNPAGFTSGVGGLNSTTLPRWSNWYGQYTAITQTDFVDQLCDAAQYTKFKAVVPNMIPEHTQSDGRSLLTNWQLVKELRHRLRDQNDDLGVDIAKYMNSATFMGRVFEPVDYLDDTYDECSDMASRDPVYMVDWTTMSFKTKKGWYKREIEQRSATQSTVVSWFINMMWNLACTNRRKNALVAKTA